MLCPDFGKGIFYIHSGDALHPAVSFNPQSMSYQAILMESETGERALFEHCLSQRKVNKNAMLSGHGQIEQQYFSKLYV